MYEFNKPARSSGGEGVDNPRDNSIETARIAMKVTPRVIPRVTLRHSAELAATSALM